jgi:uncharacterized protein YdhG (YjbR/CyaY superfamily)
MAADEVDRYLELLPVAHRDTLEDLRATIRSMLPDANEGLAYGVPAYRMQGKLIAGFAAHTKHVNYLPYSGTVVAALGDVLAGYDTTKGSVKFPPGGSLPDEIVRALVDARLEELGLDPLP